MSKYPQELIVMEIRVPSKTYCYEMKVIEAISWALFVTCTYIDVSSATL